MNFQSAPKWDGDLKSVMDLLKERTAIAEDNWHARNLPKLAALEPDPFLNSVKKQMKNHDEKIRIDEIVRQGQFLSGLKKKREKQLNKVRESSQWDKSRRLTKAQNLWQPLETLLKGVKA